jgi:hypothetical protein
MFKLHFITNAEMRINIEGMNLGKHVKDPVSNVKSYSTKQDEILVVADDPDYFTDWGCIELVPEERSKKSEVNVSIDTDKWGWAGTAQIMLEKDGQIIFNDNFQSGTKGPLGNPKRTKVFPIPSYLMLPKETVKPVKPKKIA